MGEDADLKDLEVVESEIMTRLATNEAEKAMESISSTGLEVRNQIVNLNLETTTTKKNIPVK